ncbi:AAA family ATPase [Sulfurovum sp. CS9]|uniref:AAA family ATPase n=1 Tax=Sulfurovum sp. CS9 TaxID=3391146 RepID=UPI0039ECB229
MEKKENLYKIKILTDGNEPSKPNTREVILTIIPDSWNDFSHHIRYNFVAKDINKKIFEGTLFLAMDSKSEPETKDYNSFFSMLPTMQDYRSLISLLGIEEANIFLESINDIVHLQTGKANSTILDDIKNQDIFKLAFMRNSESFFTFHNAVDILNGLDQESTNKISTSLELKFKLDSFSNEHRFTFNFDLNSILPKRLCAIIGKNGIGKSQTLHNIVKKLLKKDENFIDPINGRPILNRLLAMATPGETRNTFPKEEKQNPLIHYKRLLLTRDSKARFSRGSGDFLVQLLRSSDSIKGKSRFTLFLKSLEEILGEEIDNLVVSINPDSENIVPNHIEYIGSHAYIRVNKLNQFGGEQKKLEAWGSLSRNAKPSFIKNGNAYPLSSGQYAFYFFALQACLMIENGTLVLLDEPETHLHPNYISSFVSLLDKLLELTGSIAIIATHSSYIIRELPRSQVHVIKEENHEVNINQPRLQTFGADVGSISYFVFEDEITNRLIKRLKKPLKKNPELFEEIKDELSLEAIMNLQRFLNENKSN